MPRVESVTSAANPLLKDLRKAGSRGSRTSDGLCLAESPHLLEEAMRSGCEIPVIVVSEAARSRLEERFSVPDNTRFVVLDDELFDSVSTTENSQGVIALVEVPEWLPEQIFAEPALVMVLDGVQDPGNAGTIVRSAEAFGATGVIFAKGTVSPFHPRTLRAAAGSLFRLPFISGFEAPDLRTELSARQVAAYAAMPFTASRRLCCQTDLTEPSVMIVGSEGRGVSPELLALSLAISIPTHAVESLNAAVAASVLLYEAHRQRRLTLSPGAPE